MLKTFLTRELGLKYPLISAPMASVCGGRLVNAVGLAGGLGILGLDARTSAEATRREIDAAKGDREEGRFGIGLMAWVLALRPEVLDLAIALKPELVSISFGSPRPYVKRLHQAGILVAAQVQDRASAIEAADAGVDLVVAQGTDAGGHTGRIGTMPLLQIVLESVQAPVLVAGGIASPSGVAAVLAAGADGVWIGTAFLVCPEAERKPEYVRRLLAATEQDTVLTHAFDRAQGSPWPDEFAGRALRNRLTDRWHGHEDDIANDALALEEYRRAREVGDYDIAQIYAGQAVGLLTAVRPAGEYIEWLMEGAEELLRKRTAAVL